MSKHETYKDQLINGFAHDILYAQRHWFTYQQIKQNWHKINALSNEDKEWVLLLKDSSVQLTIMYLAKIYDSSGQRNNKQTRCLRDLMKSLSEEKLDGAKKVLRIAPNLWSDFSAKHSKTLEIIDCNDAQLFIDQVQLFLNREFPKNGMEENKLLKNLKNRRNKITVHNDAVGFNDSFSGEDAFTLISLANAVLDYLNSFVPEVSIHIKDQNYMIKYQINKIFNGL